MSEAKYQEVQDPNQVEETAYVKIENIWRRNEGLQGEAFRASYPGILRNLLDRKERARTTGGTIVLSPVEKAWDRFFTAHDFYTTEYRYRAAAERDRQFRQSQSRVAKPKVIIHLIGEKF